MEALPHQGGQQCPVRGPAPAAPSLGEAPRVASQRDHHSLREEGNPGRYSLSQAQYVVQLPSRVRLFATPRTAAHQASLAFTISRSLLKLMSIESAMPSSPHVLSARRTFELELRGIWESHCSDSPSNEDSTNGHSTSSKIFSSSSHL